MDAPTKNSVLLSSDTYSEFIRLKLIWKDLKNITAENESDDTFTKWLISQGTESINKIQNKTTVPFVENNPKLDMLDNMTHMNGLSEREISNDLNHCQNDEYECDTSAHKGNENHGNVKKLPNTLKILSRNENTQTMKNNFAPNHKFVLQNLIRQAQDISHTNDDLLQSPTCSYANIESNMKNDSLTKLSDLMGDDDDDGDSDGSKDVAPLQFQENAQYNPMLAIYEELALENSLEDHSEMSSNILDSGQLDKVEDVLSLPKIPTSGIIGKSLTNDIAVSEVDLKDKKQTNSAKKYPNNVAKKHCEKLVCPMQARSRMKELSDIRDRKKMARDHVAASHRCDICLKIFSTHKSVRRHFLRVHKNGKLHRCPECEYSTPYAPYLRVHRQRHKQVAGHKCALCPRAFVVKADMARHVRTTHRPPSTQGIPGGANVPLCHLCGRCFSRKDALNVHIRTVHDGGDGGSGNVDKSHVATNLQASTGTANHNIVRVDECGEKNGIGRVTHADGYGVIDQYSAPSGDNNPGTHRVTFGYLTGSSGKGPVTSSDGVSLDTGHGTPGTANGACQTLKIWTTSTSFNVCSPTDIHISEGSHPPCSLSTSEGSHPPCSLSNSSISICTDPEPCKTPRYLVGTGTDNQFQNIATGYFENSDTRRWHVNRSEPISDKYMRKDIKDSAQPPPLGLYLSHMPKDICEPPRFISACEASSFDCQFYEAQIRTNCQCPTVYKCQCTTIV